MSKLLGFFSRSTPAAPSPAAAGPVASAAGAARSVATSAPVARAGSPTPASTPAPDATDAVLDCLGTVLQCWAKNPILLPNEERSDAERTIADWQRHATVGTPIPGVHAPDAVSGPVHKRDWTALTSLTSERRRAEAANVGENLGDLQRVVWATVSSLARVAGEEATSDAAVEQQLDLLRACARRGDAATAMRELPAALQAITDALTARQSRAARERVAMAARVETLGRALSDAEDTARTDPMTGAGNRLRFTEVTERALALMTLSGAAASLITVDVDDLKGINDSLGHPAGDLAIAAVAKACWTVCTRATDVLCRLGGDEFAVVMTSTDATAAAALADRLEQRMRDTPVTLAEGVSRPVTASIGFAAAQHGEGVEAWIARADKRLYEAKRLRTG